MFFASLRLFYRNTYCAKKSLYLSILWGVGKSAKLYIFQLRKYSMKQKSNRILKHMKPDQTAWLSDPLQQAVGLNCIQWKCIFSPHFHSVDFWEWWEIFLINIIKILCRNQFISLIRSKSSTERCGVCLSPIHAAVETMFSITFHLR